MKETSFLFIVCLVRNRWQKCLINFIMFHVQLHRVIWPHRSHSLTCQIRWLGDSQNTVIHKCYSHHWYCMIIPNKQNYAKQQYATRNNTALYKGVLIKDHQSQWNLRFCVRCIFKILYKWSIVNTYQITKYQWVSIL